MQQRLAKWIAEGPVDGDGLVQWMRTNGVKVVAADFDLTMTTVHSGGHMDPSADIHGVLTSLAPDFNDFAKRAVAAAFPICCVTFADSNSISARHRDRRVGGGQLVEEVLRTSGAEFRLACVMAYYPPNYQSAAKYEPLGLVKPMAHDKSFHLRCVCRKFSVAPAEVLLIDDDAGNCAAALADGYCALTFRGRAGGFAYDRLCAPS